MQHVLRRGLSGCAGHMGRAIGPGPRQLQTALRQKNRGIVCARNELHFGARLADIRLKRPGEIRKSIGQLLPRGCGKDGSGGGVSHNAAMLRRSLQNGNSQNDEGACAQGGAERRDSPRAFTGRRNTSQPEKPRSQDGSFRASSPLRVQAHYRAGRVIMSTTYLLSIILYMPETACYCGDHA